MAKDYWTTSHPDGWQVKGSGNSRATSIHARQEDAWAETRARAKEAGGEAYLNGRNGKIRARNTYGNDPKSTKG